MTPSWRCGSHGTHTHQPPALILRQLLTCMLHLFLLPTTKTRDAILFAIDFFLATRRMLSLVPQLDAGRVIAQPEVPDRARRAGEAK